MTSREIDNYFASFDRLKELQRSKDFDRAYRLARTVLPGLKRLMEQDWAKYGRRVIDSSPPLEYALRHVTFMRDETEANVEFREINSLLMEPPSLAEWLSWVQEAVETRAQWHAVLDQVRVQPGVIQTDLKRCLPMNGREIAWLLYEAHKRGLVIRNRVGRSYSVFAVP